MKHFPILQGRAYVVELPEGATNPEVHTRSLTFDTPMEVDEWGYDYQSVKLPEGTWKIAGMLPELFYHDFDGLIEPTKVFDYTAHYWNYIEKEYQPIMQIESLESAILAEGYTFSNPLGKAKDFKKKYTGHDMFFADHMQKWHDAQSRVLSRERTLILRRVGL